MQYASASKYRCPICRGYVDTKFTTKHVVAAKCENAACGHIFAVQAHVGQGVQSLTDPELAFRIYGERDVDLIEFLVKREFLIDGCSVLDVGAGTGHILRSLRIVTPTVSVECVEADTDARLYLQELGFIVFSSLEQVRHTFDSILLVELIEHVDDPVALLESVRAKLNPGGLIFLTTPCGELPNGSRLTVAYDTKEHIHFFTERSLDLAVRLAGFPSGIRFETVSPMLSKLTRPPLRYVKDVLRPIRNRLFGHSHLTGFIENS